MAKFCSSLILFLTLAVLSSIALAAESDGYTVKVAEDKWLGYYLVNQSGFTLYYYSNDSETLDTSTCYDNCSKLWPPFFVEELILPEKLRSIDFKEITRKDGTKQTTFMGWPLYLYSEDEAPDDIEGQGVDGVWHVVDPTNQPQMI